MIPRSTVSYSMLAFVILLVTLSLPVVQAQQSSPSVALPPMTGPPGAAPDLSKLASLFQLKTVPGTRPEDNCTYISTPQPSDNQSVSWTCPAGKFCLASNVPPEDCTPGFACPANTAQPLYCCPGYYCPTPGEVYLCPQGRFCPTGSTESQGCHFLAHCPAGSGTVPKIGVAAVFIVLTLIVAIVFAVKNRYANIKSLKYKNLLQYGYDDSDESAKVDMGRVGRTFDISFRDIGLTLPTGVIIMSGVTGQLQSGRCCAILGPSGAGKTTFVSLLTGKAKKTSGHIMLNGVEEPLSKYKKLIGFVPQEDVMLRELTVRDILIHSALMRLPAELPLHSKKQKVLDTINYLGLGHVMDSAIGDEQKRGISGGQRKRVNIGMELVANPSVLFLDEPTSGLDSATSYEVCSLLHNIAHKQRLTVAAVIHSPSPQAFNQFDDLLVLGKGGRIVYFGPRDQAIDYFQRVGFTCPAEENPADFYIAVTSGKIRSAFSADFHPTHLFEYWERSTKGEKPFTSLAKTTTFHQMSIVEDGKVKQVDIVEQERGKLGGFLSDITESIMSAVRDIAYYIADVALELFRFILSIILFLGKDPVRQTPNVLTTFWLCYKRACMQIYRSRNQFLYDQLLHLGCGVFISVAARQFDYLGRQPDSICNITPGAMQLFCRTPIDHIAQAGVFMSLGVLFSGMSVGIATFGNERVVYWRDSSSGMNTVPYFLAKIAADIPRVIIAALCFSMSFVIFFPYRSKYVYIYTIIMLLYASAFAMGYFISVLVKKETAGLVTTAFSLAWAMLFSGSVPDLEDVMTSSSYRYTRFIWEISAPRWAVEALFIKEVSARPFQEIYDRQLPHHYFLDNYTNCIIHLIIIAIGWNFLTLLALKLTFRDKTK